VAPEIAGVEDYFAENRGTFEVEHKDAINTFLSRVSSGSIDQGEVLQKHLNAYSSSVWVHACVSVIAKELAAIPIVATFRASDGSVSDQPSTDQQAAIDNSMERLEVTDYIEVATQHLNLAGTAPIVAMRRSGDLADPGGPIEWFRPLRPSRVRAVPGEEEFIKQFIYSVSGEETIIHPDNVAFLRFPDPNSDYWGESPITVLARSVNVEKKLGLYNELLLDRGGRPNGVFSTDSDLQPRDVRRIEHEIDRRIGDLERTGKSVVLPWNVKPTPTDFAPKDMMWLEMFAKAKNAIIAIYGVPPIKVMDLRDASKLANASEQRKEFREGTLFHQGRKLTRALTRVMQLTWGPQWGCRHRWEEAGEAIDPIDLRRQSRLDFQSGIVTRDEARMASGAYGPAEDAERGSEFSAAQIGPGAGTTASLDFGGNLDTKRPITAEHKRFARSLAAARRQLVEPELSRAVRLAFTEQKARVLGNLSAIDPGDLGKLFSWGEGKTLPLQEQQLLDKLFDSRHEGEEFRKLVGPVYIRQMIAAGSEHLRTLLSTDVIASLRASTSRYEELFVSVIGQKIQQIQETTRAKIVDVIRQGFSLGFDPRQLGGTLAQLFDRWGVEPLEPGSKTVQQRADLIAQTETTTLFNGAAHAANLTVEDEGGLIVKSWSSLLDGFERDDHKEMDTRYTANPIPVSEPFVAQDGARLMYPGDPAGPVHQIARCRCTQIEQVLRLPNV
jgi:phage portal protein BeeE